MSDLISRKAAIDAMDNIANFVNVEDEDYILQAEAIDNLKALPSIQPETRKGKWIGGELGYCTCCGHEGCASDMWSRCDYPHCPNCGAEMEGVRT